MNTESAIAYRLKTAAPDAKFSLARSILSDCKEKFLPAIADEIVLTAGKYIAECGAQLGESPTALYARARLAAETNPVLATELWARVFQVTRERDPYHLLAYAKALSGIPRHNEAALALQRALYENATYSFLSRAETTIRSIDSAVAGWHLRECRMALLGSTTTSFLAAVLKAYAFRDRIKVQIYEGLYGSASQEILNPASGLARFQPQIVFLIPGWRDLRLAPITSD